MTQDDYIQAVAERLRATDSVVSTAVIGSHEALVAYRSRFRLRWLAIRVHLFTVVVGVPRATASDLAQLTRDALDYGIERKGRSRGQQSGVAVIVVLVGSDADEGARRYARMEILREFAAWAWPTVVDLNSGSVFQHEGRVFRGFIFSAWMRKQVSLAVGTPSER